MNAEIYLDTARLGRMCHGARRAEQDFATLVNQFSSLLYLESFLAEGYQALPRRYRKSLLGLRCWHGVAEFKQRLRQFVSLPDHAPVLLAGQSRTLIQLAAECLFRRCRKVFACDLDWPPYLEVLSRVAADRGCQLYVAPLRTAVLYGIDRDTLTAEICEYYRRNDCDGLFLSDITSSGNLMPVKQILANLRCDASLRFVVVDGAQALNHRPVDLSRSTVDIYLAGTQKWFEAHHPLRIAFAARNDALVQRVQRELIKNGQFDDPLLDFVSQLEGHQSCVEGATANVIPLLAASGALRHWQHCESTIHRRWDHRLGNNMHVTSYLNRWSCPIHQSLTTGMTLLDMRRNKVCVATLRKRLASEGVLATTSNSGHLRLALPFTHLSEQTCAQIMRALLRAIH